MDPVTLYPSKLKDEQKRGRCNRVKCFLFLVVSRLIAPAIDRLMNWRSAAGGLSSPLVSEEGGEGCTE